MLEALQQYITNGDNSPNYHNNH